MVVTIARNSKTLLPADPIEQEFAALFPHLWDWIFKDPDGWHTNSKYPLSPRDLIEKWRSPYEIVGVRFGNDTRYLKHDVDAGSLYHPANDEQGIKKILGAMESIGLTRHILVQSSDSTGLHIYFPLPESVNSFGLACASRHALERAGLTIKDGTLEIFPHVKAYSEVSKTLFKGHRLPLQSGSYLLDSNYQPYSQSIESFLSAWKNAANSQDMETLSKAIATAPKPKTFKPNETDKGKVWRSNLESRISVGWTDKAQTNELMFQIAQYGRVFLGIDNLSELAEYTATKSKSCNGFYQYSNHTHEVDRLALDKAKNVMENYYPYGSKLGISSGGRNAKTKKPKTPLIDRVMLAVQQLGGQIFERTRDLITAIRAIAKCSPTPLYEFKELWEPLLKNCNAASSNDSSDLVETETTVPTTSQNAETFTESGVTVLDSNEVFLLETFPQNLNAQIPIPDPAVSKFSDKNLEPIQDKEFKQIMTFEQQMAIANICPTSRSPEPQNFRLPKDPPRQNPSTLENIKAIVTADPSKVRSQLGMLKTKLTLPWVKGEERSQTEQAIAWLEDLDCDYEYF